jgi:pimeloyl-ACP methyl ester carboxylesterase
MTAAGDANAASTRSTYDVAGPPDGPPIIFIHGTRLSRAAWTAQLADLRDEYRVIALDLPGHGALVDEPFTLPRARAEVLRVIDEAAAGRAVLAGLSLGGYVAMDVAAAAPDKVRALILSGATAEPTGLRSLPYRGLASVMKRFDGARLNALNAGFFRRRFPAAIAEPIVAGGFWTAGGADALRALAGEAFAPRLAAYPGPTLIINGEYDLPFRLFAGSFARSARHPRRVRLGGATHLANLDRPAAFDQAIRTFLEGLHDDT